MGQGGGVWGGTEPNRRPTDPYRSPTDRNRRPTDHFCQGKCSWLMIDHVCGVLAYFGPFSGPGANGAFLSSKVTTNGN